MDFARKIGKPDKPRTWKKERMPFVTTRDNLLSGDTTFSEDHRLVNWKKWVANRKKQCRYVESVTGRPQTDQLQSCSERFRAFVEIKHLMERAISISTITDKSHAGPEFFKSLPDREDIPSSKVPSKDLSLLPDLMHVGIPDLTVDEWDFTGVKTKQAYVPWERSEYLKMRKLELSKEIASLLPKEPEMATLAVQGSAFREKKRQPRIPPITITEPDEEELYEDTDRAIILKIQHREFTWQRCLFKIESAKTNPITWSLIFESKINEKDEKEIVLENKGTRVIVYYWRDSSFRLADMPFVYRGSPFFFNKTRGLILPGQIIRIKVWYQCRVCGVFSESWRLVTEPKLHPSPFLFRFWGCAFDTRGAQSNHQTIDKYLDRCVRNSVVLSVIEEIMAGVEQSKPPELVYKTLFLQSDLFSCLNPCYFYHPNIVMQLREMYCNVTVESAPPWNLSLDILRDILLQIKETNYRRDMLSQFNHFCKQCLRPNLYDVARNDKNDAVYNILSAFANLFEDESEFVKANCLIREEPVIAWEQKSTLSTQSSNSLEETCSIIDWSQSTQEQIEEKSFDFNYQLYREVFFIRIYKALEEAIGRVCAVIDSFNRLNEPDK